MAIGKYLNTVVLGAALGLGLQGCGSDPVYETRIGSSKVTYQHDEDKTVLTYQATGANGRVATWRCTDEGNDGNVDLAERLEGTDVTYVAKASSKDSSENLVIEQVSCKCKAYLDKVVEQLEKENGAK